MKESQPPQLDPSSFNQPGVGATIFGNLLPQVPAAPVPVSTATSSPKQVTSPISNSLIDLLSAQLQSTPSNLLSSNFALDTSTLTSLLNASAPQLNQPLVPTLGVNFLSQSFDPNLFLHNNLYAKLTNNSEAIPREPTPPKVTKRRYTFCSFWPYPTEEERSGEGSKPSTHFKDYHQPKYPGRPLEPWEEEVYRKARIPVAPQPEVEVIKGIPPLNSIKHQIALGNFEKWGMKIPERRENGAQVITGATQSASTVGNGDKSEIKKAE